jgi:anti-anti-sigma factor
MGRVVVRRETVVALPEEIDLLNATRVAEQLTSAVRRNPAVIIDMTATTFCDCAGARAIVQAHKRATGRGAELRLVVTAEPVRRIFGLLGIDHLLDGHCAWPSRPATIAVTLRHMRWPHCGTRRWRG